MIYQRIKYKMDFGYLLTPKKYAFLKDYFYVFEEKYCQMPPPLHYNTLHYIKLHYITFFF